MAVGNDMAASCGTITYSISQQTIEDLSASAEKLRSEVEVLLHRLEPVIERMPEPLNKGGMPVACEPAPDIPSLFSSVRTVRWNLEALHRDVASVAQRLALP